MKAKVIVERLLEAVDPAFAKAMQQATAEFIADERNMVYGGGRDEGRRIADAYDINCGMCEEWGERVRQLYQEATGQDAVDVLDPGNMSGNPDDSLAGHVFLRFNGRFYDCECQHGVNDWRKLPLFTKQMEALDPDAPEANLERHISGIYKDQRTAERKSEVLKKFKASVRAYLRWVADSDDMLDRQALNNDLLAMQRMDRFEDVQAVLAKWELEDATFLSMVKEGYFV